MILGNDKGFTVIELLIAIQLSLLVVGLAYVSYKFSSQLLQKWESKIAVETQLHSVSHALTSITTRIDQIKLAGKQQLRAIDANGDTVSVLCRDSLTVNNMSIGNIQFKLSAAEIKYLVESNERGSERILLSEVNALSVDAIEAIEFQLSFHHRGQEHHLKVFSRVANRIRTIAQ